MIGPSGLTPASGRRPAPQTCDGAFAGVRPLHRVPWLRLNRRRPGAKRLPLLPCPFSNGRRLRYVSRGGRAKCPDSESPAGARRVAESAFRSSFMTAHGEQGSSILPTVSIPQPASAGTRLLTGTKPIVDVKQRDLEALERLVEKVGRIDLHSSDGKGGFEALLQNLFRCGRTRRPTRAATPPRRQPGRSGIGDDQREHVFVVSLAADRLNCGRADAWFGGDELSEAADSPNIGIPAGVVDHSPVAHDIVHDDQRPAARQFEGPAEILGGVRLVRVDEDQVERPAGLAASFGSASSARPVRTSTVAPSPARAMLARATSACAALASREISRPPAGSALASQIVL